MDDFFGDEADDSSPRLNQWPAIKSFLDRIYDPSAERMVLKHLDAGTELAVYEREQIPLKAVTDLVRGWRHQGARGNWPMNAIHWAAQIKGRSAWLISTLDPAEDCFRVWKITYGGRSKTVPTVVEVAAYRRTFERVERVVAAGAPRQPRQAGRHRKPAAKRPAGTEATSRKSTRTKIVAG